MQDLNDKITGNDLTAGEWNQVPSELQNVIENTAQALAGGDLNQLGKGIAQYAANGKSYTDSGAANAYVLSPIGLKQSPPSYTEQMAIEFVPANTNTGASTVNVGGLGNKDITDTAGGGELVAGSRYELRYNSGTGEFEIQTIATGQQLLPVTATVAANALTLGLNDSILDFRNSSITSGIPNTRQTGDLSLIVPSGATLGTINAIESRLILLALDNAGSVELAVVNLAGGNNLDETTLITTVAIDATADSNNVIYSAVARVNVPFRVVEFVDSTQAAAGTWATSPSKIQGAGGNALTAMSSIGYGQTWQDVVGSRAINTTYYNTTGKPIFVNVWMQRALNTAGYLDATISVDGVDVDHGRMNMATEINSITVGAIVPPGSYYSITYTGVPDTLFWKELR